LPDLRVDDLLFGVFGPEDGYANPKEVLRGFRAAASAAGVQYLEDDVIAIQQQAGRVRGGACRSAGRIDTAGGGNEAGPARPAGGGGPAAGPEPRGRALRPPLSRCVPPRLWPYRFPMVIDPGGLHWRHDDPIAGDAPDRIVLAKTKLDEPYGENFACDTSRWV